MSDFNTFYGADRKKSVSVAKSAGEGEESSGSFDSLVFVVQSVDECGER